MTQTIIFGIFDEASNAKLVMNDLLLIFKLTCVSFARRRNVGEMYEGKFYPLEKNLTYFLEEFAYVFLPLEIKFFF